MQTPEISSSACSASIQATVDYDAFLQQHLQQAHNIMRYQLGQETLWVKRAARSNPKLNYQLLKALSALLGTPVLSPVPNPGGTASIRTEVQRLRNFKARGIRVPQLLASSDQGFVIRHLGHSGQDAPSLSDAIEASIPHGSQATLSLWRKGLRALQNVHAKGEVLSQAVARNMVVCGDGEIGFIDFEDDPAAHLPRAICLARDALNYAQSTALFLQQAQAMHLAQPHWQAFVRQLPEDAQQVLHKTVQKLGWLGKLPRNPRLGRDTLRVLAAHDLLTPIKNDSYQSLIIKG